jgi:hypothetical protein
MLASASTFTGVKVAAKATVAKTARRANVVTRAGQYDDELLETAVRRVFFSFRSIESSRRRVATVTHGIGFACVSSASSRGRPARSRVARRRMRAIERETNRGIFTSKRIPRSSATGDDDGSTTGRRRRDDASIVGTRATLVSWSGLSPTRNPISCVWVHGCG